MTASKELVLVGRTPLQDWELFVRPVLPCNFGEYLGTVMSDAQSLAESMGLIPSSSLALGMLAMEEAGLFRSEERDGTYILFRA